MVMKHYPPEFKADAVALYESRPGSTIKQVAEDLGVNPETLRNWIRAAGRRTPRASTSAAPAAGSASLEAENAALRRENAELRQEREILRHSSLRRIVILVGGSTLRLLSRRGRLRQFRRGRAELQGCEYGGRR
ncbi:transposase [Streptomyces sp. SID5770]|uniref:transposase n=1 Tax=Streptomyces sp. SID5770 TaxID=2690308 RepID=UPI00136C29A7|nr:transposase [Streptomyces sp. SID5770]MZE52728.1 transposase [Streptomyces sp. SID5770]